MCVCERERERVGDMAREKVKMGKRVGRGEREIERELVVGRRSKREKEEKGESERVGRVEREREREEERERKRE